MTLKNGSFEDGWIDLSGAAQQPNSWLLIWNYPGGLLQAPKAGNGDTENAVLCVPECVHKLSEQLPADEQLGGKDALILDGSTTYKLFGHSAFRVLLTQQFEVDKSAKCTLIVPVQAHGGLKPDGTPYNVDTGAAYWRVSVNGEHGAWLTYNNDFQDREWFEYGFAFTAVYGTVDIMIEFESHTVAPVAFFTDNVQFSVQDSVPIEPECWGLPRVQYERTYLLLPQDASLAFTQKMVEYYFDKRYTFGSSADDAGIGALDIRNVLVLYEHAHSWDMLALDAFYREFYEGVTVEHEFRFCGDDPDPPPIDPPPVDPPKPIIHYSDNFIGLQHAYTKQGWTKYIREAHPVATKCFTCGETIAAKKTEPRMLSIWRKHVDSDGEWLIGDRYASALRLLDLYSAELQTHCNSEGISIHEALQYIDVIESLNETVPSNNAQHINAAVEFDVYFSQLLHDRYGDAVVAGLLTVAIGNPLESEVELLLPAAKQAYENDDYLTYHAYWAANRNELYLDDAWPYHAGRWQEWDLVFVANGYYPKYYLGECGIVHSPDGQWLIPTEGWKSCGDFPNYIQQLIDFNELIRDWNYYNQGRCFGGAVFIYGAWGWDGFDFSPSDLLLLTDAMKEYA